MHFTVKEEPNFLQQTEVAFLREQVYNSEQYWKHVSSMPIAFDEYRNKYSKEILNHYDNLLANQYFLGDAIYVMDNKLQHIDVKTQEYMKETFSWLYDKVLDYFKELYSTDNVKLHDKLPVPGFHIFRNTGTEETETKVFDWHNDTSVDEYVANVKNNSVYSFVLLVENIEDLSHLDFKINDTQSIIPYTYGCLHLWNGNIWHRIGSMKLKPNESRITFQGHLYYDEQEKFYKLYF
jgi:hypothetical protein